MTDSPWLSLLRLVGPALVASVPTLRPIVHVVIAAVEAAERQPTLTGRSKKEYALRAIAAGVAALNAASETTQINPDVVLTTASDVIDLVVATMNLWKGSGPAVY